MNHMVDLVSVIKLNTCPGRLSTFQRTCIVGIGVIIQISCFLFRNWGVRIKGQKTVKQGQKAVLEGIVQFHKSIKYLKWQKYHNGEYFDINIHSSKFKGTTTSLQNPVLQIHEFDVDDDVPYRLVVVMVDRTKYSDHQRIRLIHKPTEEKPRIEIYTDQKNTRYFVGEDVTIKANIDRSTSILSATWQRKTENGSQTLCTALPKYTGSKNRGHEHLLIIKNCNESDKGIYFLLAACTYSTEDVKSNELHLDIVKVTEEPTILLHLSEESESIQYGNTITLKAEIKACPAPSSIHWKKKDKDGKIEEIIERSGKFVIDKSYSNCQKLCIKNLDLSDNGDYEIIVTNAVGETRAAIEIKVEADTIIFISGPTVVAPSANIKLQVDYPSKQGVTSSKWMKIKNLITNQLTFESLKYSIGNSASTGCIKTQKVVISNAEKEEDSAAYHLSLGNMKSNKLNIFVDDCGKYSTEQEGNCLRFFVLQTVSANAMRIAFDNMKPIKFEDKKNHFEQNCKSNPKLKEVFSNIVKKKLTSSRDLDISLMYVMIRNSTINPIKPKNGWGKKPSENDRDTADDIERIRLSRNRISHENALNMETSEFNKSVLDLIWAIRRLSKNDVKLMGDVSDVMNKVFTKGEIMEGLIEELKEFQKEAQNWEQLFQNEESQLIYQRSWNEDIRFHSAHGSDISLLHNDTLAIRRGWTENGICLMNRPLKIGEKVHIRGILNCYIDIYGTSIWNHPSLKVSMTSIPPETFFGTNDEKEAVMEGLINVDLPRCIEVHYHCPHVHHRFHEHDHTCLGHPCLGHPIHLCISLCPNGSVLVRHNETDVKDHYRYPEVSSNTPLWLVIKPSNVGSIWISHD